MCSVIFFQNLRDVGVVGKFVEFFGSGVTELSIADRATIANMCPEYGATIGFFPPDARTLTLVHSNNKFYFYWLYVCYTFIWLNVFTLQLLQEHRT